MKEKIINNMGEFRVRSGLYYSTILLWNGNGEGITAVYYNLSIKRTLIDRGLYSK